MIEVQEKTFAKEKNIKEQKLDLEKEKMVMAPNYMDTTSLGLRPQSDIEGCFPHKSDSMVYIKLLRKQ
jgi:hypothetical protein